MKLFGASQKFVGKMFNVFRRPDLSEEIHVKYSHFIFRMKTIAMCGHFFDSMHLLFEP